MFKIHGNNQYASLEADFDIVRAYLEANRAWGAEVLKLAGEYGWRQKAARKYSLGLSGAKTIPETSERFIAWGLSGKKSFFAYRIERQNEYSIRVTPVAYLENTLKTTIMVTLAAFFIVPLLFSPFFWRLYEMQTYRSSKVYLPAFCRYLEH